MTELQQAAADRESEVSRLKRLLAARPTEMALFAARQNAEHYRAQFEVSANRANALAGEVAQARAYEAAAAAWLQAHGDTHPIPAVQPTTERLPLGTIVTFQNGVQGLPSDAEGVIVGWSTVSCQRYEVAFLDRHFWRVNRRCFDRAQFQLYTGAAENAVERKTFSA